MTVADLLRILAASAALLRPKLTGTADSSKLAPLVIAPLLNTTQRRLIFLPRSRGRAERKTCICLFIGMAAGWVNMPEIIDFATIFDSDAETLLIIAPLWKTILLTENDIGLT